MRAGETISGVVLLLLTRHDPRNVKFSPETGPVCLLHRPGVFSSLLTQDRYTDRPTAVTTYPYAVNPVQITILSTTQYLNLHSGKFTLSGGAIII